MDAESAAAIANLRLLLFDVDGVLTDGSIFVADDGREMKRFHVRDGFGIRAAMSVGIQVGVITGRSTRAVNMRMSDLGIELLLQGVKDKAIALETICQRAGIEPHEAGYLGDDLIDLPAMLRVGYPMAVADAVEEVRSVAQYTTTAPGGRGAAREAIEHVLKAQGKWADVVDRYGI